MGRDKFLFLLDNKLSRTSLRWWCCQPQPSSWWQGLNYPRRKRKQQICKKNLTVPITGGRVQTASWSLWIQPFLKSEHHLTSVSWNNQFLLQNFYFFFFIRGLVWIFLLLHNNRRVLTIWHGSAKLVIGLFVF